MAGDWHLTSSDFESIMCLAAGENRWFPTGTTTGATGAATWISLAAGTAEGTAEGTGAGAAVRAGSKVKNWAYASKSSTMNAMASPH